MNTNEVLNKLIAEIERRKKQDVTFRERSILIDIETAITSLQQEQQKEICPRCIHYGKDDGYCHNPYDGMLSVVNENGVYECTGFCEKEQEQPENEEKIMNFFDALGDCGFSQHDILLLKSIWKEAGCPLPKPQIADASKMEQPEVDLEVVAAKYELENRQSILSSVDIVDAFIAGAEWQKEQMTKAAVEGVVHHVATVHYIAINQKQLNACLTQFDEGTEVVITINARKEEKK